MSKNNPYIQSDDDLFDQDNLSQLKDDDYLKTVTKKQFEMFQTIMQDVPGIMRLYDTLFKEFMKYNSEYDTLDEYKKGIASRSELGSAITYYLHNIIGSYMSEIYLKSYMNFVNQRFTDMKEDNQNAKEFVSINNNILHQILAHVNSDMLAHYEEACDILSVPSMLPEIMEVKDMLLSDEQMEMNKFAEKMEAVYDNVNRINASF